MKINKKIEGIIYDIKYAMLGEIFYARQLNKNLKKYGSLNDHNVIVSKLKMENKMQYIFGLADALRHLGFNVSFSVDTGDFNCVNYYRNVEVKEAD